jgi:glycerophosphoryl diester phosphodiesterase
MNRPILLGHRGASKYAPENTPAAFDLALEHGCDGFEFDVRYTNDARAVICHDLRYRRKRIDACSFDELTLCSAEEVIRTYAGRAYLDIELKVSGEVRPILESLRGLKQHRFVISSFLPDVLTAVNAIGQALPLALICENTRQLKHWPSLPIRALMIHQKLVTATLVDELHAADKKVFVWTVNRDRVMRHLAKMGVDGLISDDTQLLVRTFKQK